MDLTVIVPWWDHAELLTFWDKNLEFLPARDVIFVDNGSQPENAAALSRFVAGRTNVRLLRNEKNRGYAAANNQGVAVARSARLLFLNNDIEILAAPPVDHWFSLADAGIAGPPPRAANELGMPYVEGWALCTTKAAMDKVLGWSEDYGAGYWDDVDLSARAWINGIPVSCLPTVDRYLRHLENVTGHDGRLDLQSVHYRNLLRFARNFSVWLESGRVPAQPNHPLGVIDRDRASQTAQEFLRHGLPDPALSIRRYLAALPTAGQPAVDRPLPPAGSGNFPGSGSAAAASFGINLVGQLSSSTGLGTTARHTAKALRRAGVPLACFDVQSYYATGDVADETADIADTLVTDVSGLRFPVNLYCLPVFDFPQLDQRIPGLLAARRLHAAVVWWETTKLHPGWLQALMRLDAVIAYSEFLAEVLSNSLALTPVLTGRQALFLPPGIEAGRAAFGVPADTTVFISSFDPSSDPARKNPAAVINAFRHAFADSQSDVRLIFRLNNARATQMGRDTLRLLAEAASGDSRISFALEPMSYREVLSLYASADVHVSLHRAEGLGLGMLESMRLGIPVIATGWSGNMTFMDHRSACLVRYRLIQAKGNHPFYQPEIVGPDARWAEPVLEDAISWMRHLYHRPDERRRIGLAGRRRTEHYQHQAMELSWLQQLEQIEQTAGLLQAVEGKFSSMGRTP
ncbi:MAG: glycosyltransferase [Sulfuritalea sp.]|nr:glycosyltransferase [Sulfuritalea sp.]